MATVTMKPRNTTRHAPKILPAGPDYYRGLPVMICSELELGERLTGALRMWFDPATRRRALRTSPASVFGGMNYGRSMIADEVVIRTERHFDEMPVTDAAILTPASSAWEAFLDLTKRGYCSTTYPFHRLRDEHGESWAAAVALHRLGFAVAESLALLAEFGGESDGEMHTAADQWEEPEESPRAARRAQVRSRRR